MPSRLLVPFSFLLFLSGCASALEPFDHPGLPDPADAAAIRSRGELPGPEHMLEDVRLITRFRSGDDGGPGRDTIYGAARVASHLRGIRERDEYTEPFRLRPRNVLVCGSLGIEAGRYPTVRRGNVAEQIYGSDEPGQYYALWRETAEGWRLAEIVMEPVRRLEQERDPSCDEVRNARRESRRFRFGVALRVGQPAEMGTVEDRLTTRGWDEPAVSSGPTLAPKAWVGYRITPVWSARLGYLGFGRTEVVGSTASSLDQESFSVRGQGAFLTFSRAFGGLEAGIGPVLGIVRSDWTERVEVVGPEGPTVLLTEEAERRVVPGAMAELTLRLPLPSPLIPVASVGYTWFPDSEMQPTEWGEPASLGLGGVTASLGLVLTP